ncbi:MAG: TlpA family protein disulfide reductase [Desulfovibrionaceae bacterium]
MPRTLAALTVLLALALAATPAVGGDPQKSLQRIPDAALQATPEQCAGLPCRDGHLKLSELPGRFLLLEVFSMYCPYCQSSAPEVNRLHQIIAASKHADQFSLAGLGAGNSRFEVEYFKDKFDIAFPLFPDRDMHFYNRLPEPGTPYFILAKKDGGDGLKVLWTHIGPFDSAPEFFSTILGKAGLEP